ncbi:MAG: hypothetical protein QOG58_1718 [Caballeronia sp.]|nr:hypothetical protein [Caballeronia sp.]
MKIKRMKEKGSFGLSYQHFNRTDKLWGIKCWPFANDALSKGGDRQNQPLHGRCGLTEAHISSKQIDI